jgi:hypothetical protein
VGCERRCGIRLALSGTWSQWAPMRSVAKLPKSVNSGARERRPGATFDQVAERRDRIRAQFAQVTLSRPRAHGRAGCRSPLPRYRRHGLKRASTLLGAARVARGRSIPHDDTKKKTPRCCEGPSWWLRGGRSKNAFLVQQIAIKVPVWSGNWL